MTRRFILPTFNLCIDALNLLCRPLYHHTGRPFSKTKFRKRLYPMGLHEDLKVVSDTLDSLPVSRRWPFFTQKGVGLPFMTFTN